MLGVSLNIFTLAIRNAWGAGSQFAGTSLNLDFTSGTQTLDPRVTFTRSSNATRINSAGVLELVSTNGPRFDYDPVTLQPKGLLIEEQRTNLTPYSRYETGAWSLQDASIGTETKVGIDGSTIIAFLASTVSTPHRVIRAVTGTYTANSVYSFSFYVAKPTTSDIRGVIIRNRTALGGQAVSIAVSDGGAGSTYTFSSSAPFGTSPPTSITASDFSATPVGNGWVRLSIKTAIASADTSFTQWDIGFGTNNASDTGAGTANSQLFIDSVQLEAGAFPTSYIPTTTAAATRAADVAVMTGDNFASWYNAVEGSFYSDAIGSVGSSTVAFVGTANDGTTNNFIDVARYQPTLRALVRVSGGPGLAANTGLSANAYQKAATSYTSNQLSMCAGGGSVVTAVLTGLPVVNRLDIGNDGQVSPRQLNGHIRRIAYFPRRLSNAELQGVTS